MISIPLDLRPGSYVLAASGGVDSMVLLNLLRQLPEVKLTLAHFDHGIRDDSAEDRRLIQAAGKFYSLPVVYDEGQLDSGVGEAKARTARYQFLERVRQASNATAIITAHHQDDVLETAILNLMRGTGRRGLSSLQSHSTIARPLLQTPKATILDYAREHELLWREDSTNADDTYARNYVRHHILPRFDADARAQLLSLVAENRALNEELEMVLQTHLHLQSQARTLDKQAFVHLPHAVAREVLASWLRARNIKNFDRPMLERLVVQAKTQTSGNAVDICNGYRLQINRNHLALAHTER